MSGNVETNVRPQPDDVLVKIADYVLDKNIEINNIKTTNVNILLNRVKLDKKKTLRKKIAFSFGLIALVSLLSLYFII